MRSRHALAAVLTVLSMGVAVAPAHADFGITSFDGAALNQDGTAATQAGSHPFTASTLLRFNTRPDDTPDEQVKDVVVDLPAGLVGKPTAVPPCPQVLFQDNACPTSSQVGVATVEVKWIDATFVNPLYLLEPRRGTVAQFGFSILNFPSTLTASLRPDDHGVRVTVNNIPESIKFTGTRIQLWGIPYESSHDPLRFAPGNNCYTSGDIEDPGFDPSVCPGGLSVDGTKRALVTNPTACTPAGVGVATSVSSDSWETPGVFKQSKFLSHLPAPNEAVQQGPTGCDKLDFNPSFGVAANSDLPDTPTGLQVDLGFPDDGVNDPQGLASAQLKDIAVTLPEGMTINPAGANGLAACTDAQLGLASDAPIACPEASKVGSATASSPLLNETLTGSVYVRSQVSDDPESGDMFRVALVLENAERGLLIKLPGNISADSETGRLTTTFKDNPQVPVSKLSLAFKGGARAPLATPPTCGTKTIDAQMTAWSGQTATRDSPVAVACTAGLGGFAPSFSAGTVTPVGGAFSPFSLSIIKPDGNAALNGLALTLPSGVLARVRGNLGTQVGSVKAYAGPGSNPFVLPGQVFLEGPYGDAPFSLRVVVPAKAGPFDLGEVVVRQKIYVDPITAQVTVVSDPVPTIVKGVPVRLQRLDVSVDKPGFTINPTSCAAKAVGGTLSAAGGQTAPVNVRFQVGDCGSLALKPSLALSLSGKGQTTDGKHPAVTADLTQQPGQANLKKVRIALPLSLALDPDNANGLCEFVDGSKVEPTCPKNSIVGTATATTPILDQPLTGPVYFVKNIRKDPKSGREIRTLPKLVIPLVGQNGVKLTLTGTSDVQDDQLVTTFDNIPDAPVSSFKLSIIGGKGGILTVSGTDICKATQIADQQIDGQNNKAADADVYIQTPSCPLKVISKKVGKTSVAVKVGGLGAGKVTVTGKGIRKTTKTVAKSTVATITARRTTGKPGRVAVSFLPKGVRKAKRTSR